LAFPDALIWARLAGAVVLVGFAGQTTAPELKEAKEKLARIRVQVLGAILSNVRPEQNTYRYGYSYRASSTESARKARRQRKLLLPAQAQKETAGVTSES
jgi:Mrp family chromosome partitioning ATPase